MGKPGGFFKKLKAKQKRQASKTRRGTKGASKEDRVLKHNERVEYFAARRQAEELAAVSSSSDDEASTDSEAMEAKEERKLRRLRRMLGVQPSAPNAKSARPAPGTAAKKAHRDRARQTAEDEEEEEDDAEWDTSSSSSASPAGGTETVSDAETDSSTSGGGGHAKAATARQPPSKRTPQPSAKRSKKSTRVNDDVAAEDDPEDWQVFLGKGDSDDDDDDDEEDEESDAEMEEGEGEGEGSNDDSVEDDDDAGDDFLIDDEEEEDGGVDNPLFGLDEEGGDDDDGADLFNDMLIDPAELEGPDHDSDEEEDEEMGEEDAYVEEDDGDSEEEEDEVGGVAGSGKNKKKRGTSTGDADDEGDDADTEGSVLLPQFKLGTSHVATLRRSLALSESDVWFAKYHLDQHGEVDPSGPQPVSIAPSALAALKESNAPLIARAEAAEASEVEETSSGFKRRKNVHFVAPADYADVHPENLTVAATRQAQAHFLHPPFDLPSAPSSSPPSSSSASASAARKTAKTEHSAGVPSTSSAAAAAAACQQPPYLHEALWEKWATFRTKEGKPAFTVEERGLLDLLQGYPDVMDCLRCWQNADSRREVYLLHLLNHWFKARAVILAHDKILAAHRQRQRAARQRAADAAAAAAHATSGQSKKKKKRKSGTKRKRADASLEAQGENEDDVDLVLNAEDADEDDADLELRDRGFGKTRLFVMLPMRNSALRYVKTLIEILQADPNACPKLEAFARDFSEVDEAVDPTFHRRPIEYQRQFDGNIDDSFCVGLRLEPNRVHLYAHPLNSDIIICSPLGLRKRLEKNGDIIVSLASIEVCVMDEAHVLLEQNWAHVTAVMELLNKRPTDTTHGLSDLRRVYAWALEGKSGRHRQNIISTNISNATMIRVWRTSVNNSGKVILQHREEPGALSRVLVPVRQHFLRFEPSSLETADDDRFEFFTRQVYATKINPLAERDVRVIVLVPSYFDFVRLRNYLYREYRESFAAISEYTSVKQQRKALGQFSDLERPVLLLTERFYFFRRYFVKHAEVMCFYSPPLFPEFYASLINRLVSTSPNALAMTTFCRYDTHELNRIVGTTRMRQMLERDSGIFSFLTS